MYRRIVLAALLLAPAALEGQTLAQRVTALGEGTLRLSFAARPDVAYAGVVI